MSIATLTESISRRTATIRKVLEDGVTIAMRQVVTDLQAQAAKMIGDTQGIVSAKRYHWGTAPSAPGSPPRRVTGKLVGSLFHKVFKPEPRTVTGRVGSTSLKAKWLEFGATIPPRRAKRNAMIFYVGNLSSIGGYRGRRFRNLQKSGIIFRKSARGFRLQPRPWLSLLLERNRDWIISKFGATTGMRVTSR